MRAQVFARRDFHCERVLPAVKIDPHGLRLVHGREHTAAAEPFIGRLLGVVVQMPQREAAHPRRQRIVAVIVGDAQRLLELDRAARCLVNLRESEN